MSTAVERSVSRGREGVQFASSGRGGAGNIRANSGSRDGVSAKEGPGPDDYSQSRGRELPQAQPVEQKVFSSGRGGAGNIRSPSRDAAIESRNALREEARYVREHTNTEAPVSHGRGGAGNIANSNSRSRSRSRDPTATPGNPAVLVGRGGYGNVKGDESGTTLGRLAEEEQDAKKASEHREKEEQQGQLHSTGRGGFANLFHRTSTEDKSTRDKSRGRVSGEFVSGGRGGAGNIHKS